jgi:hypothetical protein
MNIRFDGAYGLLHDQPNSDCGSQMDRGVAPVHQLRDQRSVSHGPDTIVKQRVADKVLDVTHLTCGQVIEDQDSVSLANQTLSQV